MPAKTGKEDCNNNNNIQPTIKMPGTTVDAGDKSAAKRKRQDKGDQSKKRRKSGGADDVDENENDQLQQIPILESQILESRKHFNNIPTLLEYAENRSEDPKTARAALEALCRVFIQLLALGSLVKKKELSEKDATVVSWLRAQLLEYERVLISMFESKFLGLKALLLAMALLKAEALHLDGQDEVSFPRTFFSNIISGLFMSAREQLREEFSVKFVTEFDDIRFYTFQGIKYVSFSLLRFLLFE